MTLTVAPPPAGGPFDRLPALILFLALALVGSTALAFAETAPVDSAVTTAVDHALLFDPSVLNRNVDVTTQEGIVTLTGRVNHVLARDRAQELAETVKGVRAVINRLRVEPSEAREDGPIRADVVNALLFDTATDAYQVEVRVEDGAVTLAGQVSSWQERELAERVAEGVIGVRSVENALTVDYGERRTPRELRAEVEARLRWDAYVDDALIEVSVDEDGHVSLGGQVASAAEKRRARRLARVRGVQGVDADGLEVETWARDPRFRDKKYVEVEDPAVMQAIRQVFRYDPRVEAFDLPVVVNQGWATLSGTVDHLKARRAAERDALGVVGVWGVTNLIKVRGQGPSDDEVATRVRAALARDPYVSSYQVDVSVRDGVVTLSGEVDSLFEKGQADDVISTVEGAAEVKNRLTVNFSRSPLFLRRYPSYGWIPNYYSWYEFPEPTLLSRKGDWQLERDVQDQLFWSPFVNSAEVEVEVDNGHVRLTGAVDTLLEKDEAARAAREAGAAFVDNDLQVDYGPDRDDDRP